ncbi:amino acid permease-domain-containing protein [Terfezia claveryi]|nr:amino acid permease-domain-containing protein [Terfezia claveryi]
MEGPTPTDTFQVRSPHDNTDDDITGEETNNGDITLRLPRSQTAEERALRLRSLELMGSLNKDRRMHLWDVVTLNLNSIIGTGIFTTPGLILVLTKSKIMTLTLWFAGAIYSLLGVYIYSRYSKHMLFNGGEFLWLDAVFKRPKYFFAITVAGFFLTLDTGAGNCLAFAKQIGLMRNPKAIPTQNLQRDAVAYLAVSVLSLVCFIHFFFSPRISLFLNRCFAWFKVAFMIAIIVAGIHAGFEPGSGRYEDWGWHMGERPPLLDVFSAIIFVIYSFMGWQTVYYVAGEVGEEDRPNTKDLEFGSVIAVLIASVLYLLVTLAYCLAIPFDLLVGDDKVGSDLTVVLNFIPRAFHTNKTVWAELFIALSAFGYLISTVYAYSRLNQKIFRQRFFPFYQFCDRDHIYYKTPTGGLIVQWFWTVLNIVVAPNSPGGYGFIINVKSYGHIALGLFLGIGIFFMHTVRQDLGYDAKRTCTKVLVAGALLALISAFFLIVSAMGHGYPAHWHWPVALAIVLSFFLIYWALFRIWLWYSGLPSIGTKYSTVHIYEYHPNLQTVEVDLQGRRISHPMGNLTTILASNDSPPSETVKEIRIREKLVYRWNKWGETRLIVYNWSDPVEKWLKRMYKLLAMPQETNKVIPQAGWVRLGSPSPDMGAYTMVRERAMRGSTGSPFGTLRGSPPGVAPSPQSSPPPHRNPQAAFDRI